MSKDKDEVPPQQRELAWGTCLGDMHHMGPAELENAVERYQGRRGWSDPLEGIPECFKEIVPFIEYFCHYTVVETPEAENILRSILKTFGVDPVGGTNKLLYLINECGRERFNLMYQYDGVRLYTICVELRAENFTTESLGKAWEACKASQESRLASETLSSFLWESVDVDWATFARQVNSTKELVGALKGSPDSCITARAEDLETLIVTAQNIRSACLRANIITDEELRDATAQPLEAMPPLIVQLTEHGGKIWSLMVSRFSRNYGVTLKDRPEDAIAAAERELSTLGSSKPRGITELIDAGLVEADELKLTTTGKHLFTKVVDIGKA